MCEVQTKVPYGNDGERNSSPLFVYRKPRDSRVVEKRLTDKQKSSSCVMIRLTCQSKLTTHEEDLSMKKDNIDVNSLAHTKWNCKYHIVFAPKYRRKVFFDSLKPCLKRTGLVFMICACICFWWPGRLGCAFAACFRTGLPLLLRPARD